MMRRRPFLLGLAAASAAASGRAQAPGEPAPRGVTHRALRFPADHGAHPDTRIEWWYVTGWLDAGGGASATAPPGFGFQVTFFRTRTGLAETSASRFAARQLVFAHVALTDLAAGRRGGGLLHDQRAARAGLGLVQVPGPAGAQDVRLRDWLLHRDAAAAGAPEAPMRIEVRADRFALALDLASTQPLLLQGDAGYSQKGPDPRQASHYYSQPQLAVRGRLAREAGGDVAVAGRAWLDHEWSDELLPAEAVGWDWLGINLLDGGALTAFRLRRADGSTLWAGGSFRDAAGALRVFAATEVRLEPARRWTSARTRAAYPVEWTLATPAGRWRLAALQDDQELDSRASTGSVYWEGLSALQGADGRAAGYGYLEMTGYAGRLRL